MKEIVNKLITEAGLTPEQANKTIEIIGAFVKEKFPMLSGAVDKIFDKKN